VIAFPVGGVLNPPLLALPGTGLGNSSEFADFAKHWFFTARLTGFFGVSAVPFRLFVRQDGVSVIPVQRSQRLHSLIPSAL